jgi:glutamate--cysteine ligase
VLAALRANGKSFAAFALAQSEKHAAYFRSQPAMPAEEIAYFDGLAAVSLAEQAEMEAAPQGSFDDYVAAYRASNLCHSQPDCD